MSIQTKGHFSLLQKMDRNKDGVVTLEEFILACQEVSTDLTWYTFYLKYYIINIIFMYS